jgi:hypothetical protein
MCMCSTFLLHSGISGRLHPRREVGPNASRCICNLTWNCRQASVDYALCGAVAQTPGIKSLLFCYDVGCQWCKNFQRRLTVGAEHLTWPRLMDLTVAVGKFHLGAHIDECFARFALQFVSGAGQIAGENMEQLWSGLNKSAPSMRAMTTSYRRESLDWLMNQSNWVKLLSIGE